MFGAVAVTLAIASAPGQPAATRPAQHLVVQAATSQPAVLTTRTEVQAPPQTGLPASSDAVLPERRRGSTLERSLDDDRTHRRPSLGTASFDARGPPAAAT